VEYCRSRWKWKCGSGGVFKICEFGEEEEEEEEAEKKAKRKKKKKKKRKKNCDER
jgi:hypothetical protein